MAHVITFTTALFDPKAERENPINPIAGESVLRWLAGELASAAEFTDPDVEDWGWYSYARHAASQYLVGASGEESGAGPVDWTVQVHKRRRFREWLTGKNRLESEDALSRAIVSALELASGIDEVELTVEA